MSDKKNEIKEAVAEVMAEKQAEAEKKAKDQSDAVELGVRAAMKKMAEEAGSEFTEDEQNLILQTAAAIDAQE